MPFRRLFARPPVPPLPDSLVVSVDGESVRIALRRVAQARRYTLRFDAARRQVVLTMPPSGNVGQAEAFARRHTGWISQRLQRLPEPVPFAAGSVLPLHGEPHRVVHRPGARGTVWTEDAPDGGRLLCVAGDEAHLARRIREFLMREAKRALTAASRRHAETLGVTIGRISIRDTRSRWGSCSASGALSYSWRLVLAPPAVLDYLAAHEVAHRVEMNHSARYWRVVASLCPDHEVHERWLGMHGSGLHRYGAEDGGSSAPSRRRTPA